MIFKIPSENTTYSQIVEKFYTNIPSIMVYTNKGLNSFSLIRSNNYKISVPIVITEKMIPLIKNKLIDYKPDEIIRSTIGDIISLDSTNLLVSESKPILDMVDFIKSIRTCHHIEGMVWNDIKDFMHKDNFISLKFRWTAQNKIDSFFILDVESSLSLYNYIMNAAILDDNIVKLKKNINFKQRIEICDINFLVV